MTQEMIGGDEAAARAAVALIGIVITIAGVAWGALILAAESKREAAEEHARTMAQVHGEFVRRLARAAGRL